MGNWEVFAKVQVEIRNFANSINTRSSPTQIWGGKSTKIVVDPHRNVSILIDPNSRDNPNGARLWAKIIRIILKKIFSYRYGTPSDLFFSHMDNNQ